MTDATETPQAPQAAAESATPAAEAAAANPAPAPAASPETESLFSKISNAVPQRFLLLGTVAAAGFLGGAAVTSAYYKMSEPKAAPPGDTAGLNETVRRLETSVAALSTAVSTSTKLNNANWARIGERFDKVEKALAEPSSRLVALSDAVEKLRAAATAKAAAPTDVTGSVAAAAPPKPPEPQKPVLSNWTLHEVDRGVATVEGRQGVFEVEVGDPLPGLDRVEAIRRQDGRWTVVTRKGIIVAR